MPKTASFFVPVRLDRLVVLSAARAPRATKHGAAGWFRPVVRLLSSGREFRSFNDFLNWPPTLGYGSESAIPVDEWLLTIAVVQGRLSPNAAVELSGAR